VDVIETARVGCQGGRPPTQHEIENGLRPDPKPQCTAELTGDKYVIRDNYTGTWLAEFMGETATRGWIEDNGYELFCPAEFPLSFLNPLPKSSKWVIGMRVEYRGEEYPVTDVDEGYGYLALGGTKYVTPCHPDNDCITAHMSECVPAKEWVDCGYNDAYLNRGSQFRRKKDDGTYGKWCPFAAFGGCTAAEVVEYRRPKLKEDQ
jgi:hypothetical protein